MIRVIQYGIFLIASAPFVLTWPYSPYQSFVSETIALLISLIIVIASASNNINTDTIKIPKPAIGILTLVLLSFLSIPLLKPPYLSDTLTTAFYLLTATAVLIAITNHEKEKLNLATWIASGICIGAALQIPFSIMQIYGLIDSYNQFVGNATALIPRFGNEPVAVGFMHQRNHLGNYLFLGGISACYLLSKLKIRPSTFLPLITAISFGLALASSRSIFLYIAFTFLIAIFFQIKKTPSQTIGKPLLLFTAIAVALQLITPHLPIPQSTGAIARIATEATFGVRWIEWQKAWLAFLEHPVLGLGNGGYARWSFEKSLDIPFATSSPTQLFTHSHNILFQLLAEYGILGGIILCTIATLIAINFTKTRKTNEAIFYFSSIAVIVIHSMVEYPLWYANFLLLFTLFIAGQDRKPLQLTLSTAAKKSIFIAAPIAGIMTCLISLSWYTTLVQLEWPSNLSNQEKIDGLIQFHGNPIFSNEADLLLVTQLDSTDQNIDIKLNITTQLMNYRPFEAVAFKHITYLMYKNKQTEAENLIKIYSASSDTFSKRYYQYLTTKVKKDHRLDQSIDLLKQDQLQRAAHQ